MQCGRGVCAFDHARELFGCCPLAYELQPCVLTGTCIAYSVFASSCTTGNGCLSTSYTDATVSKVSLYLLPCFLLHSCYLNCTRFPLLFKLRRPSLDECLFESDLCSNDVRAWKIQSFVAIIIGTTVVVDPLLKVESRVVADVRFDSHQAEEDRDAGGGVRDVGLD